MKKVLERLKEIIRVLNSDKSFYAQTLSAVEWVLLFCLLLIDKGERIDIENIIGITMIGYFCIILVPILALQKH